MPIMIRSRRRTGWSLLHAWVPAGLAAIWVVGLGGCASNSGPEVVMVDGSRYAEAFDAAVEAARREGMPATLRDRRSGVIETDARPSGSIFEPWKADAASSTQAWEQTLHFERRRVRFEFAPADQPPVALTPDQPLTGADPSGAADAPIDLTTHAGPLRLVAIVTIERHYRTGDRRSTWSRRISSQFTYGPGDADATRPNAFWTPVARDEAYERRILATVEKMLGSGG